MTLSSRRRTFAALSLCAVLALGMAGLATAADRDVERIQAVTEAAIADVFDAATFKEPNWEKGALAADRVAAMHTQLQARLSSHMTGRALTAYGSALAEAVDRDSDGKHVVVTAGGVEKIEFHKVTVTGDTGQATGRVLDWITWRLPDEKGGTRVSQWEIFSADVVSIGGHWLLASLSLEPEYEIDPNAHPMPPLDGE